MTQHPSEAVCRARIASAYVMHAAGHVDRAADYLRQAADHRAAAAELGGEPLAPAELELLDAAAEGLQCVAAQLSDARTIGGQP